MNNRRSVLFLAIFCLPVFAGGQADNGGFISSLKLREYCGLVGSDQTRLSDLQRDKENACLFYVAGVLDGFRIGDSTTKICTPDGATFGQIALVVSKYLDQYPEKLHNPPQYLVIDALHTAFPCNGAATH